ncbi:Glycoprotein-N-acetylgalactosamine 3-beta-galactosyltransferase 1 [Bulinus truncatus]|nr:Glycoprotein-N-acetylgalactosamine 3-beta-galactosyltransferase 1 [Bulinus truncatus]
MTMVYVAFISTFVYVTIRSSNVFYSRTVYQREYVTHVSRPVTYDQHNVAAFPSPPPQTDRQSKSPTDRQPKILCWVLTEQNYLDTRAASVRDTWSRRCDKFLFFSSKTNTSFPTIGLDVPTGRGHLTTKVLLAFTFCYKNYGKEFDWFLKADDDTYVIVENLRLLVKSRDPGAAVYFGYRFKPYTPQGYMSGGAGYLLSQESLRKLVIEGLLEHRCERFWGMEDLDIGRCLHSIGVKAVDSLDGAGMERFHPLSLDAYFGSYDLPKWTYKYAYHPAQRHFACCSNNTISFHYMKPHQMYILEYLIYSLRH